MSRSEKAREAARGYGSPRQFTPAASIAGDIPAGEPPTYAESISAHSASSRRVARPAAYTDNKVQVDDEFHGSSESGSEASDDTLGDLADDDETAWALDDEQAEPPSYEDATNVPTEDELVQEILAGQQDHQPPEHMPSLPCPIIVPQRDPRRGYKGFVRAYAPILQTVGIDQTTFMYFLKNLYKSTRINPWFTTIMVSSTTINTAPSAVAMAVATAMQFENDAGGPDGRRTNNLLDRMNKDLFKPAGCFAFITRYHEVTEATEEQSGFLGIAAANVDLTTNRIVPKYNRNESNTDLNNLTTRLKLFRLPSDVADNAHHSSLATLTFARTDAKEERIEQDEPHNARAAAEAKSGGNPVGSPASGVQEEPKVEHKEPEPATWGAWLQDLAGGVASGVLSAHEARIDRHRARAERFVEKHERRREKRQERYERHINRVQRRVERNTERFQSRYGRAPNGKHIVSSEALAEQTPIERSSLGRASDILVDEEDQARSECGPRARNGRARHEQHGRSRRHRTKGMTEGVLYLMIVALPTEQELANARAMLQGE